MSKFDEVCKMNFNEHAEKKGRFTYLSWSHAWREFKKCYPEATYSVRTGEGGLSYFGNSEVGYMVHTDVTVAELTHEMWLPVIDNKNKSILMPNMMDINTAIMRCLTKNLAMFGLGLYIYAGEDLPETPTADDIKPAVESIDDLPEGLMQTVSVIMACLRKKDSSEVITIWNKLDRKEIDTIWPHFSESDQTKINQIFTSGSK